MSPTAAQRSLMNFYESASFSNPRMAALMYDDVVTVAIFSLGEDKTPAHQAAYNLRTKALDLPPALSRVLDGALIDLGFPPEIPNSDTA